MLKWLVEELKLPAPPFWLIGALLILLSLHLVPLAFTARARVSTSPKPALHMILDMDKQAKYKAQADSPIFEDGRAMRLPVAGTVPWGKRADAPDDDKLETDDHYFRGYKLQKNETTGEMDTVYFQGFPDRVTVDETLLARGQRQFNIYCFPCHGYVGQGNGPVQQRAVKINAGSTGWVQPTDITDVERASRPEGHLFNTITNGIRNMAGYGNQVSVEDRWAIVAYLRALQLSQKAPASLAKDGQ